MDVRRSHVFEMRQVLRNVCFSQQIHSATLSVGVCHGDTEVFCIQTSLTFKQSFPFL